MTKSSYDIEKYKEFATIDAYFYEEKGNNGTTSLISKDVINNYCDYGSSSGNGKCQNDYLKMASSSVIHLLTNLKKYGLENDKLAEYAILWLSFKLNKYTTNKFTKLNDFYNSYIVNNNSYNEKINGDDSTYKTIINKKKDLMNIKEISKFNDPFGILFYLYHQFDGGRPDCDTNLKLAKDFADKFNDLNNDPNNKENSSYNKLLSILSNDYKNLKNKCPQFQSLSEIKRSQSSAENSVEDPGNVSGQPTVLSPEATPSSSSILNTVIPVLSTFSVISLFLGVAYKYSLFGFGKRSQKRYLRENIKK
ncbi:CIR protein [Plasmodium chabaudi adami]|uniref:CIR protein n=1 Tax=Plasmodium chabaudi adami TaxID=5826 RepID=A0A1C6WA56_PLACE|nr:CIR protein [Plasmodium chabaudi adami]